MGTNSDLGSKKLEDESLNPISRMITAAFVLVLIIMTAITYIAMRSGNEHPTAYTWLGIAFVCFIFLFLIYLGSVRDGSLSKGELRRAIAGTLTIAFTLLAFFAMMNEKDEVGKEIVIAYIQLVGISVGFYFGAKTAERDEKKPTDSNNPGNNTGDDQPDPDDPDGDD